jgi:nucleoside-diphosphate-sugar epimerase
MRLLVLGGTGFVGGATVAEALRRGWSVTVFNRGLHGAVPDGVRRLRGDRSAPDGLSALAGGEWDVTIDTWDGAPRAVLNAARALVGSTGHYVYVSSRSVYREPVALGADEHAPVVDAASNALDGSYAGLKAGGEQAAQELFGERALIARVGLILGPGEDIGRLPWWLQRVARGGQVLAPAPADLPLQYIDVRDLVTWLLDRGRECVGGTFNVVSRAGRTRQGCAAARWRGRSPTLGSGCAPSAGCHRAPAARNGPRWDWTQRVRPNCLRRHEAPFGTTADRHHLAGVPPRAGCGNPGG